MRYAIRLFLMGAALVLGGCAFSSRGALHPDIDFSIGDRSRDVVVKNQIAESCVELRNEYNFSLPYGPMPLGTGDAYSTRVSRVSRGFLAAGTVGADAYQKGHCRTSDPNYRSEYYIGFCTHRISMSQLGLGGDLKPDIWVIEPHDCKKPGVIRRVAP